MESAIFHNSLKMLLNIWVTFLRNFVLKNIQKSPKLATLPVVDVLKQFLEQT